MRDTLALILGGGRGERLYPLTKHRAKPALPLAGKYRLIDIPVSNCINSGILKIFVLTQFNSASLNRHIAETYRFSPFMRGFVDILAAQQTPVSPGWFEGTADAVRKSLWVIEPWSVDEYLILSGDHLYRMDYRRFIHHHRETQADVTISVLPVKDTHASSFGLLKTDGGGWVTQFSEKPIGSALEAMRTGPDCPFLGSMGIYIFKPQVLKELLRKHPEHTDFGHNVIPAAIEEYKVQAYPFHGYWEDIGTVESFYHANLALVKQPKPEFSFFNADFPIYTHARFLPPSKVLDSTVRESMICDGCLIRTATITRSIVGIRSWIEEGVEIENTLMMGADSYETERATPGKSRLPAIGIGAGSVIRNAIIDKNARIGKNVRITNAAGVQHADREEDGYCIRSGIVIVIKGAVIKDNSVI